MEKVEAPSVLLQNKIIFRRNEERAPEAIPETKEKKKKGERRRKEKKVPEGEGVGVGASVAAGGAVKVKKERRRRKKKDGEDGEAAPQPDVATAEKVYKKKKTNKNKKLTYLFLLFFFSLSFSLPLYSSFFFLIIEKTQKKRKKNETEGCRQRASATQLPSRHSHLRPCFSFQHFHYRLSPYVSFPLLPSLLSSPLLSFLLYLFFVVPPAMPIPSSFVQTPITTKIATPAFNSNPFANAGSSGMRREGERERG